MPIKLLISHAAKDKTALDELERHLTPMQRAGKLSIWHRDKSFQDPDAEFQQHLDSAQIVVLLVSPDLELDRFSDIDAALAQRERGVRVIPVQLRAVDLSDVQYKTLRMLPDGAPIADRRDRDQAWVEVVKGIRRVAESLPAQGAAPSILQPPGTVRSAATAPAQAAPPPAQARPAPATEQQVKILFLAANPANTSRLKLDEESRAIDQRIRNGELRDRFRIDQAWAVTVAELSQTLLRYSPTIVHFSGHGSPAGALVLANDAGGSIEVPGQTLAGLFKIVAHRGVRCVVLNACYSAAQADAIAQYVDCVVGLSDAIQDKAAIAFSAGFYTGLAAGDTIQTAFELGRWQILGMNLPGADLPQIHTRTGVDPTVFKLL